jgi:hypothetical protein
MIVDTILIQQIYPDTPGVAMLELVKYHSEKYCQRHGYVYQCTVENPRPDFDPLQGSWGKIELIREALELGYKNVIWLDADTLITDFNTDLRDAIQPGKIGACWHRIPQLSHWNVGALYVSNTAETRAFIDEWLASYPPPADDWMEQGVFNRMAMKSKTVVTLSDKWNATLDVNMVPDAVVLGFHGQGDTEYRINIMKQTMDRLFPSEKAETPQGKREVT